MNSQYNQWRDIFFSCFLYIGKIIFIYWLIFWGFSLSTLPNARDALITSISYLLKKKQKRKRKKKNVNQSSSSYWSPINKSELNPSIPNRKSKNLNKRMVFTCISLFHPLVWLGQISIATYFHYLFFLLFFDEQMIVWLYSTRHLLASSMRMHKIQLPPRV